VAHTQTVEAALSVLPFFSTVAVDAAHVPANPGVYTPAVISSDRTGSQTNDQRIVAVAAPTLVFSLTTSQTPVPGLWPPGGRTEIGSAAVPVANDAAEPADALLLYWQHASDGCPAGDTSAESADSAAALCDAPATVSVAALVLAFTLAGSSYAPPAEDNESRKRHPRLSYRI
jgi:hypothetical protein